MNDAESPASALSLVVYANVTPIPDPLEYKDRLSQEMELNQMFTRELTQAGHVRRFTIREAGHGWEVREEQDSRVVHRVQYDDWHRVERALLTIREKVFELEQKGWSSLR